MYFPDDREENWSKLDLCVRVYSKNLFMLILH